MQEQREIEITISDLLVSLLRNMKQIVIFAIICGLILGCYQGFMEYQKATITPKSEALEEYYRQLRDLEKTIERSETGLENEREYVNESIYMGLSPYKVYCCEINLSLDNIIVPDDMLFGQDVNPTDYLADKIRSQYTSMWNALDLGKELGLSKYASVEDRYVRELISMYETSNGLTICAYEATESDARTIAKAAYDLVKNMTKDVVAVSYRHQLVQTAINTKLQIDEGMRLNQEAHYDKIDTYIDSISESEESIKKLDVPDTPFKAVLKKMIIGGAIGFILAGVYVLIRDIFKGVLQSVKQLTSYSCLDFLGNIAKMKGGLYGRFISSLSGEKNYASEDEALSYIGKMAESYSNGGKVFVSSTLDLAKEAAAVQSIMSALKDKGIDADFGPTINTDPASLEKLKAADKLLLIENCGKTLIKDADEAKSLAEKLGKKPIGFVLI